MTEPNEIKQDKAEIVEQSDDSEVLFENILAEVRASNCKDRTRLLIDSINDEIKEVMQAINKYGKDGKITITVNFKCVQANEMLISASIEGKKPKGQATGTKMYRDMKGRLYMDDPMQMKLLDTHNVHSISRG